QVYLQDDLFKSGVRPAVDVGISVSRVGGDAQIKAMKKVAGTMKLDLAQFRELEAFATFGSELDKVSAAQLERGYRLTELLKQNLNSPMPVEEQVVVLFAGTKGFLDDLPVADIKRFENDLLDYVRARHADFLASIRETGDFDESAMETIVKAMKLEFAPSASASGAPLDAVAETESELAGGRAEATLPEVETTIVEDEE
ncbi:MAG: F0F1 ATP synthase subunit alpha, partial [Acidimicrobiales bacterium]|nr:F0F1 ATP synthase subunit alpha [Acidimicrobiales bacterium]